MAMSGQEIRLPKLEARWRWPRLVSSCLAEIEQECLEWISSFTAFDSETQNLVHEKGKLSESLVVPVSLHELTYDMSQDLLAAMCYARMSRGETFGST